jgi:hypothetical protein
MPLVNVKLIEGVFDAAKLRYRQWRPVTAIRAAATDANPAAAREDVDARVWSGIHWRTSDRTGRALGQRIGHHALRHALQPTGR